MADSRQICSVCGKQYDQFDEWAGFGFDYFVGYGSRYDLHHLKACICIACFDRMMDMFIPMCKVSPDKGEYQIQGETVEEYENT